jgi:hypothetical protein
MSGQSKNKPIHTLHNKLELLVARAISWPKESTDLAEKKSRRAKSKISC